MLLFYSLLAHGVNGSFVFPVRLLQFLVLAEPLGNFIVGGAEAVRREKEGGGGEERNDTLEVSHVYCYEPQSVGKTWLSPST